MGRWLLTCLVLPALCLCFAAATWGQDLAQKGNLRVAFSGALNPKRLPRSGRKPVSVQIGGAITTTDGSLPPTFNHLEIALNNKGRLDPGALPTCRASEIQPSTTAYALQVCGRARVGEGTFDAAVAIPEQAPFPSVGEVVAFNGIEHGRPVILLHIYGTTPVPTSLTVPLAIKRGKGEFGTVLSGDMPSVDAKVGFVKGISLRLDRKVGRGGRAYLSAGCPAPKGFPGAVFSLAKVAFSFGGGRTLRSTLVRNCRAIG